MRLACELTPERGRRESKVAKSSRTACMAVARREVFLKCSSTKNLKCIAPGGEGVHYCSIIITIIFLDLFIMLLYAILKHYSSKNIVLPNLIDAITDVM